MKYYKIEIIKGYTATIEAMQIATDLKEEYGAEILQLCYVRPIKS